MLLGDPQLDQLTQVFRLGLLHSQPGVDRVELDQGLARLDAVADVMMNLDDPAAAFRAQGHLLPAPQGADDLDGPLDRPVLEGATVTGTTLGAADPLGRWHPSPSCPQPDAAASEHGPAQQCP